MNLRSRLAGFTMIALFLASAATHPSATAWPALAGASGTPAAHRAGAALPSSRSTTAVAAAAPPAAQAAVQRLDPELRARLEGASDRVPVFVLLRQQSGLDEHSYRSEPGFQKDAWRQKVVAQLRQLAATSQAALLDELRASGAPFESERSFWIVNGINLTVGAAAADRLAASEHVERVWLRTEKPADIVFAEGKFSRAFEQPPGEVVTLDEVLAHEEISWNLRAIQADLVWSRLGLLGRGAVIAILDSGVNYRHSDFRFHLWRNAGEVDGNRIDDDGNGYVDDIYGFNFANRNGNVDDDFFHGNSSASIMVGDGRGGILTGVAPAAELMVLRMYDQRTRHDNSTLWQAYQYDAWEALQYAVAEGADVVNMSFAWEPAEKPVHAAWRIAATNVVAAGVTMVAGSGNFRGSYPMPGQVRPPASVPAVIATGGTLEDGGLAPSSSRGPVTWSDTPPFDDYPLPAGWQPVAFSAPWGNFPVVAFPGRGYEVLTGQAGSSLTSPHVAGVIALMLEQDPELMPEQIRERLARSSRDVGEIGDDPYAGAGLVQAYDAIMLGSEPLPRLTAIRFEGGPLGPRSGSEVSVELDLANPGAVDPGARLLLTTPSDDLRLPQPSVLLEPLGAAATVGFPVRIEPSAAAGSTLPLRLEVRLSRAGVRHLDFELPVWGGSVLLVDDDGGGFYEREWRRSLERLEVPYDLLSLWPRPRIDMPDLGAYGTVVWIEGEEGFGTLSADEQRTLDAYVTGGGRLVLVGQNVARDLAGTPLLARLGARYVDDVVRPQRLAGAPGTLLDGFAADFTAAGTLPDSIAPDGPGQLLLPLEEPAGAGVAVGRDNAVLLTIEIAGIDGPEARDALVCRLVEGCSP